MLLGGGAAEKGNAKKEKAERKNNIFSISNKHFRICLAHQQVIYSRFLNFGTMQLQKCLTWNGACAEIPPRHLQLQWPNFAHARYVIGYTFLNTLSTKYVSRFPSPPQEKESPQAPSKQDETRSTSAGHPVSVLNGQT
jgi:hypothetical protein